MLVYSQQFTAVQNSIEIDQLIEGNNYSGICYCTILDAIENAQEPLGNRQPQTTKKTFVTQKLRKYPGFENSVENYI